MVRSRLDIWVPMRSAKVLLRLRNEVYMDTDARVPVGHVFSTFNFRFRQGYTVLSHARPELRPSILFIPEELAHAVRKFQNEAEVLVIWFVRFTVGNKGGENGMCENEWECALVLARPTTADMGITILFVVLPVIGGHGDQRWSLNRARRKRVSDAFVCFDRIFRMLAFVTCSGAG